MKSVVTINGRNIVPHKFVDGRHMVSNTPFHVKTYADDGTVLDNSVVPFGPDLYKLLRETLPNMAAGRGEDLNYIGRITKKTANGLDPTELAEDEALADLLKLYDSRARKWAFDPSYLDAPEVPKHLMDRWFAELHKLSKAPGSTSITSQDPNLEVLANEIVSSLNEANTALPDWLRPSTSSDESAERRKYLQLMAAMSEAQEPGYMQRMIDEFRRSELPRVRNELAPALDELLGGIVHNKAPNDPFSWTRDQEMAKRDAMRIAYDDWAREIVGSGMDERSMQEAARQLSVPKSKLLTTILNSSMDFNPIFGDTLQFVDPEPDPIRGPRSSDRHGLRVKGLWSPTAHARPYFEHGNYPVYNFNSDLWKNPKSLMAGVPRRIAKEVAEAKRAAENYEDQVGDVLRELPSFAKFEDLNPVEMFERMGMDPRRWGGADTFADWSGGIAMTDGGKIRAMNYLEDVLNKKKRGWYDKLDLDSILGEDYREVLNELKRNKKRKRTEDAETAQRKEMIKDKSNIHKWNEMNSKHKRQAYKTFMQNMFAKGITDETGVDWASLMAQPQVAEDVRKKFYAMREQGLPLNDIYSAMSDTIRGLNNTSAALSSTQVEDTSSDDIHNIPFRKETSYERNQRRKNLDAALAESAISGAITGMNNSLDGIKAQREHDADLLARDEASKSAAKDADGQRRAVIKVKAKKKPDDGTVDLSDLAATLSGRL